MMTVKELIGPMKFIGRLPTVINAADKQQYYNFAGDAMDGEFAEYKVKSYTFENNALNIYVSEKKDTCIFLLDVMSKMNKDATVCIQYDKDMLISGKVSVILEKCKTLLEQRVEYIEYSAQGLFIEVDGNMTNEER